jgi:EmrB/QacA subfamily drug resistance transporter
MSPPDDRMPAPAARTLLAHELDPRARALTLAGVLLGMFLAALDQTVVATAGPAMQAALDIPVALYPWITTAYLVASTVMVPIYGKLSDRYGRKPVLLFGILVFLLGSFLCGVAPSTALLLLGRTVQGLGSASLFTSAFAIVADLFPPAVRGRYTGLFGAVFGISSVVGPLLGGFITDHFGWHWVFFINLPIGAVAVAFVTLKMPRFGAGSKVGKPVDVAGALALVVGVVPLLLALSLGERATAAGGNGWASPHILGLFAVAAAGVAAFLLIERRAPDPILDLTLFKNRAFAWGNLGAFVIGCTFLAGIVFLPLFMVKVVGLSASSAGLTLTPLTLGLVAGNVLSGQLVSRVGRYKPFILGAITLLAASFALLAFTLDTHATQAGVTVKMVALGLGLGPSIPLYMLAIQNSVAPNRIGVATATATFSRSLGGSVGLAIVGTAFAATMSSQLGHAVAMKEALTAGVRLVFVLGLVFAAIGFLVTIPLPELPLRRTHGAPPPAAPEPV